ncbi:MAG: 4Fe-4S binding protein [bacterium]
MKRKVITIDDEKCNGCGLCIPNCPEGAIRIIDGKARLVGDYLCDGLGACLGHCPESAITIEEREAEPYDERKVMTNVMKQGMNVVKAHLEHLDAHGETDLLDQALTVLREKGVKNPLEECKSAAGPAHERTHTGCPGSEARSFSSAGGGNGEAGSGMPSQLTHWPVQLHLVSPLASQYKGKDVVLAADCVAYALGNFHNDYLKGKALAIACPKLDGGQDGYVEKIRVLINDSGINTLMVMIMEVPCCRGLLALVERARSGATRKVQVKLVVVGTGGEILKEEWV